jgi:O-acetylserine/cysteine efflux transporter
MSPLHAFFAVMVALLWGCNFVAAKYGVAYYPPFLLTAIRFTLASFILIPLVAMPPWRQMKQIMLLSTMSALHFSLIFVALYWELDIASSALIGQLGVPFACILGAMFLNDRIGPWRIAGIIIAFIGTAIVSGAPNILQHMPGFYAALGSTFTWGIANVMIKRIDNVPPMSLLAWMGLFTVPILLGLSYMYEFQAWPVLWDAPLSAILGVSYTALGSTIVAYGLWYFLLTRYAVSQVTPYSLLTPIFGIAIGQMFFREELTMPVIVGGIITILGVAVIVIRRPRTIPLGEAT